MYLWQIVNFSTIRVIATNMKHGQVYLVLHFQIHEDCHLVEGGVSGISFCPGELKPFRDLNIPKFFFVLEIQLKIHQVSFSLGVCMYEHAGVVHDR